MSHTPRLMSPVTESNRQCAEFITKVTTMIPNLHGSHESLISSAHAVFRAQFLQALEASQRLTGRQHQGMDGNASSRRKLGMYPAPGRQNTSVHKRLIGIIAGIPVARHLKTTDDLFDSSET